MKSLPWIFGIITFVIPALFILGDDRMWQRKKKS